MPKRKIIPFIEMQGKTLSLKEVEELFNREAVLFGEGNGIPDHRVRHYFGGKAVAYAISLQIRFQESGGKSAYYYNSCDVVLKEEKTSVSYLTWNGFKAAATYHNVNLTAIYEYN